MHLAADGCACMPVCVAVVVSTTAPGTCQPRVMLVRFLFHCRQAPQAKVTEPVAAPCVGNPWCKASGRPSWGRWAPSDTLMCPTCDRVVSKVFRVWGRYVHMAKRRQAAPWCAKCLVCRAAWRPVESTLGRVERRRRQVLPEGTYSAQGGASEAWVVERPNLFCPRC